jgi:hypothetical protein
MGAYFVSISRLWVVTRHYTTWVTLVSNWTQGIGFIHDARVVWDAKAVTVGRIVDKTP